jgi:hypothetical protein
LAANKDREPMSATPSAALASQSRPPSSHATFADIEARIDRIIARPGDPEASAEELLQLGEQVLERWLEARGEVPTGEQREGFRLLALHRQGARGDPSFNACRETCRELAYYYNLIKLEPAHPDREKRVGLAAMLAKHLALFVSGKMQVAGLGEFCCAAKPLRAGGK